MKTIRRTRITIRKRDVVMVKNNENQTQFEDSEMPVCPLCHSQLHAPLTIESPCSSEKLLTNDKNLLAKKN